MSGSQLDHISMDDMVTHPVNPKKVSPQQQKIKDMVESIDKNHDVELLIRVRMVRGDYADQRLAEALKTCVRKNINDLQVDGKVNRVADNFILEMVVGTKKVTQDGTTTNPSE